MKEIDPRKLVYFASVVEHGSLSGAAAAYSISQPAITASMDRLEAAVGTRLLERGRNGVVPTQQGNMLYSHARQIREELKLAQDILFNPCVSEGNMVRLGSLPSLSTSVIPAAISRWRQNYADVSLVLTDNAQIDLLTGLLRRDFDLMIGFTEVFDVVDGLRQQVLFRDTLCVVARANHPLQDRTDLDWKHLLDFAWISPTSRLTHSYLEHVIREVQVGNPRQITVCGSVSLLKSLVASSDHLALLPVHAVQSELAAGELVALPFTDRLLHRNIAVFYRDGFQVDTPRRDLVQSIRAVGLHLTQMSEAA